MIQFRNIFFDKSIICSLGVKAKDMYHIFRMSEKKQDRNTVFSRFLKSAWVFPASAAVIVIILTTLKLNGSSIGIYNDIFYGSGHHDSNLVLNKPRSIRSDEWVWNSQMIMAQSANHFKRINPNLGHGMDMSLIIDVPYKDWSMVFRPQNLPFFVLPFDYAFALKWWLMGYLLLVSAYFFVLKLLPGKRLLAALMSVALLFSPFIQWWYQYITVAPFYYCFFILLVFMSLIEAGSRKRRIILSVTLAYLMISFILILYPPFQIACALATVAFAIGYLFNRFNGWGWRKWLPPLRYVFLSMVASLAVSGIFVLTRYQAVKSIESTAYPGQREVPSGGYDFNHLMSGHLDFQLQFSSKATKYQLPEQGITNQSEASNFTYPILFLILPAVYLFWRTRKSQLLQTWTLALMAILLFVVLAWLFIPHLDLLSQITLLTKVPPNRLVIGLGLLNFIFIIEFIRQLAANKNFSIRQPVALGYMLFIFIAELLVAIHAKNAFPGFIGIYRSIAFSIPLAVIVYLIIRKRFLLAALGYAAFSVFMTIGVHPLYRGTGIITSTELSKTIRQIAKDNSGYWAVEDAYLENFAFLNGAHSYSGIYSYPQLEIWSQIKGADPEIYNRYAHTNFTFYRDAGNQPTKVELAGGDHFGIDTEPCGDFIRQNHIKYLLTDVPLNTGEACLKLIRTVHYPALTALIYRVD